MTDEQIVTLFWNKDERALHESEAAYGGYCRALAASPAYSILTTAANDSMREVHDRMPLVLEKAQIEPWREGERASFLLCNADPCGIAENPPPRRKGRRVVSVFAVIQDINRKNRIFLMQNENICVILRT